MCDICRLVSEDVDGGRFITSLPPCPKGREVAAAHGIQIMYLSPPLTRHKTQWASSVSLDADEVTS
jgi:hypothetical protein